MIVLDTNIVSALMRTPVDPPVEAWLRAQQGKLLATTVVTVMEVRYGIERTPTGKRRAAFERRFNELLDAPDRIDVLDLEANAASLAGEFLARREQIGRPARATDMIIAAIVASSNATLATRNVRDFLHLGLQIENPYPDDEGSAQQ